MWMPSDDRLVSALPGGDRGQGRGRLRIATRALRSAWFLCVMSSVLNAASARAGSFSATASAGPSDPQCAFATTASGGSGFASASTGPVSCAYLDPTGGSISSTASASGSWISGDFSTSAVAAANPGTNAGASIVATGSDTFAVAGVVTLPSGMASTSITFGVTGLSGSTIAGPASSSGGASSGDKIELDVTVDGTTAPSGTSVACVTQGLFISGCPNGGFGSGLALAPITLTVDNGAVLELRMSVQSTASADAYVAPESASANLTVDPLFLTLPTGATFDSGIPGFLSAVPEPSTAVLFGSGLVVLASRRRRDARSPSGA